MLKNGEEKNCSEFPLISVIVPVYKVELYLCACIDSIINQTYKNIEIIIVDDGSPDKCPEICDSYSLKDKRVQVIHQKNGGVSDARNTGINIARGEYLLFVDSDDKLADCDVINNVADLLLKNHPVITYCSSVIRFTDEKYLNEVIPNKYDNHSFLTPNELLYYVRKKHSSLTPWSFIVCREFVIKHQLYFRKGIYYEDTQWIPRLLLAEKNQKIQLFSKSYYLYRYNPTSITSSFAKKNFESLNLILTELSEKIKENQKTKVISDSQDRRFVKKWFNRYLYFLCMYLEQACLEQSDLYKNSIASLKQLFEQNYSILDFRNKILFIFLMTDFRLFYYLRLIFKRILLKIK